MLKRRSSVSLPLLCLFLVAQSVVAAKCDENTVAASMVDAMLEGRAAHTATLLRDGTVLIAGGFGSLEAALTSVEVFDPRTQVFFSASALRVARQSHTATLLHDGRVLVAGGYNDDYLSSAELYDPTAAVFRKVESLLTARSGHTATLLGDGRVLILGGVGTGWQFLTAAEIYDPATGRFQRAGQMLHPRESHTATLLQDGRVLIAGGHNGTRGHLQIEQSAEIYDPLTGRSTETGLLTQRRHKHDAVLMKDGRVLLLGGADERDQAGAYDSAEIYDQRSGRFAVTGRMQVARYKLQGTSLLLQDGSVLVAGGAATPEIYRPELRSFRGLASQSAEKRMFATATLLPGGDVLLTGGYGPSVQASTRAWLIHPR
jgi:hypothetical protein